MTLYMKHIFSSTIASKFHPFCLHTTFLCISSVNTCGEVTKTHGDSCHIWQFCKVSIELPDLGSSMDTFLCGQNCRTQAVLLAAFHPDRTAGPRQFYGHFSYGVAQNRQNCGPWQFYGHFSVVCYHLNVWRLQNCRTQAVLWTNLFTGKQIDIILKVLTRETFFNHQTSPHG